MRIYELISDAISMLATNFWCERLCWTTLIHTYTHSCSWKHWEARVTCGRLTGRRMYSKKVGQRNSSIRNGRQIVQEQTGGGGAILVVLNVWVSACLGLQMLLVWKGLMGNQWQGCAYDQDMGDRGTRGRGWTLFPVVAAAFSDVISHSKKRFGHQMFRLNMVK